MRRGSELILCEDLSVRNSSFRHEHIPDSLSLLILLALCVVGQTACQTQRQIAAWEGRFTEGNPREEYAAYVKGREENARLLRQAVAEAATMRIRVVFFQGKDKVIPLTAAEVSDVREMVAAAEDSPPRDYATWLEVQVGMMGADTDFQYGTLFEWGSADGKVVVSTGDAEYFMDDIALAGQYRTSSLRHPAFLVPSDTLKRWRSLPGLNIMRKKTAEPDGGNVCDKSCGVKCPNSAE